MSFFDAWSEEEGLGHRALERARAERWTAATGLAAVLTGLALRSALERGWRAARDEDPPEDPTEEGVSWADALLWAVVSGVAVALGRVIARRGVGELRRRRG